MKNQPAFKAALILAAGIFAGRLIHNSFSIAFFATVVLTLLTLTLFLRKLNVLAQFMLFLSLMSVGILRYQQSARLFPPDHILRFIGRSEPITVKGFLTKDPTDRSGRKEWTLETKTLTLGDSTFSVCGKILVRISDDIPIHLRYGDEITLRGELRQPAGLRNPGGFDYRAYLTRKDIYAIIRIKDHTSIRLSGESKGNVLFRRIVYPARRYALRVIDRTTTGQSRSILKTLLVGERGAIDPELRDEFAKAGIIHVLAVSGLHVGFVLLILATLLGLLRIPYTGRVYLILLGLLFYALLTEAKAPVVRASIMAAVYLVGTLIERRTNPFNVVGVSALIILLIKPQDFFDVGFQLSFTAVLSIIYFYRKLNSLPFIMKLQQSTDHHSAAKYLLAILLVSLSAQLGTLPLTAVYFNRIPLLALFVNVAAIPLVGIIVALGFTSIILGIIHPWIASVYGALNQELLSILIKIVSWIGNLPFSHVSVPSPNIFTILGYFLFVFFLLNLQHRDVRKKFAFLFLFVLNLIIWKEALWNDTTKLTWIQFDVGQGDAALLCMPRGKTLLIDGGDRTPNFDNGERVIAPYLRKKGIRQLDAIVLSHPHNDHIGGLVYILNHFNVSEVVTAASPFDSKLYREFLDTIRKKNIPVRTITAPDSIMQFPGIKMLFLSPTEKRKQNDPAHDANNQSLVVRILFGKTKLLFAGDAEREAEVDILNAKRPISCNTLKVAHHGSNTSSTLPFIIQAHPQNAVISVGQNNRFRHPSDAVIERFRTSGATIYRTDLQGAVIFRSDGETLEKIEWR